MRAAQFASLLALLLTAVGCAQAPAGQRGRGRTEPQTQARTVDQKTATWEVTGFGETVEDADRNALRDARAISGSKKRRRAITPAGCVSPPPDWSPASARASGGFPNKGA